MKRNYATKRSVPLGLVMIYVLGACLIALNLKNYLLQ